MEEVITRLKTERDAARRQLEMILEKYSDGGFYSKEDSSAEDYWEGKIVGLDYAIQLIEGEDNA